MALASLAESPSEARFRDALLRLPSRRPQKGRQAVRDVVDVESWAGHDDDFGRALSFSPAAFTWVRDRAHLVELPALWGRVPLLDRDPHELAEAVRALLVEEGTPAPHLTLEGDAHLSVLWSIEPLRRPRKDAPEQHHFAFRRCLEDWRKAAIKLSFALQPLGAQPLDPATVDEAMLGFVPLPLPATSPVLLALGLHQQAPRLIDWAVDFEPIVIADVSKPLGRRHDTRMFATLGIDRARSKKEWLRSARSLAALEPKGAGERHLAALDIVCACVWDGFDYSATLAKVRGWSAGCVVDGTFPFRSGQGDELELLVRWGIDRLKPGGPNLQLSARAVKRTTRDGVAAAILGFLRSEGGSWVGSKHELAKQAALWSLAVGAPALCPLTTLKRALAELRCAGTLQHSVARRAATWVSTWRVGGSPPSSPPSDVGLEPGQLDQQVAEKSLPSRQSPLPCGRPGNSAAVGTAKNSAAVGTAKNSLAVGTAKNSAAVGTAKNSPVVGTAKNSPVVGTAKNSPAAGTAKNSPAAGTAKNSPAAGTAKNSPAVGTAKNSPVAKRARKSPVRRAKNFSAAEVSNPRVQKGESMWAPGLGLAGLLVREGAAGGILPPAGGGLGEGLAPAGDCPASSKEHPLLRPASPEIGPVRRPRQRRLPLAEAEGRRRRRRPSGTQGVGLPPISDELLAELCDVAPSLEASARRELLEAARAGLRPRAKVLADFPAALRKRALRLRRRALTSALRPEGVFEEQRRLLRERTPSIEPSIQPTTLQDFRELLRQAGTPLHLRPISDIARRLHDEGLSLLPLSPGTKEPGISSWRQWQREQMPLDRLRAHFQELGADAGLAIICGPISGLVVADLDDHKAVTWAEAHLPPTPWRTQTARGQHWFYRHPVGAIDTTAPPWQGQLQGEGRYVVAPGSLHPAGGRYEALGDWGQPRASLPVFEARWLVDVEVLRAAREKIIKE